MRYVLDTSLWKDIEADGVLDAAKGAFGVCERRWTTGTSKTPTLGFATLIRSRIFMTRVRSVPTSPMCATMASRVG